MKLVAQALPANLRRSPLAVLGFLVLFVVAAYKAAGFVIADDMTGLAFVGMAFVVCAIVIAILNDWRKGLYFFLAWLLFEDFARKYLGNNMAKLLGLKPTPPPRNVEEAQLRLKDTYASLDSASARV